MSYLLQFDRSVFIWINTDWTNAIFSLIMPWITHLGAPNMVWVWIVGMAIIVALSRIYLGVHFPGDVLFGAFLGWSMARLMLSFQWLKNRITREKDFYPDN